MPKLHLLKVPFEKHQPISTFLKTRTKTSIRYAKENEREKRERKKGRRRDMERGARLKGIER